MDDQLDNDLKNHIKEVFDNYEDTSADEGWLQLREKFPQKQSNRRAFAWLWLGSAAAILLAFLSIGLWIYNTRVKSEIATVKPVKNNQTENVATNKLHPDSINKAAPAKGNIPVKEDNLVKNATTPNAINQLSQGSSSAPIKTLNNAVKSNQNNTLQHLQYGVTPKLLVNDTAVKSIFIAKKTTDSTKKFITKTAVPQLANNVKSQSGVSNAVTVTKPQNTAAASIAITKPQNTVSNAVAVAKPQNTTPNSVVIVKPQTPAKSIMTMFAEDNNEKKPIDKETEKSKRVHFGVYETTYFNYAKGSNNQVNVGAGFTSDIRISKNLKLVTGVAIAQNSLSYDANNPSSSERVQDLAFQSVSSPVQSSKYTALSTPTAKNYNASLVGLDIPLNLKYEFNPQKSDAYISAGVSSGTFINESYSYSYNYPSFQSPSLQQTQGATTHESFNNFYFAKTLNVAFGIGYPFGKNRVVIEPFLKYPLDGLGMQNLRFGAGGLNLKFNFQSSKK